MVFTEAAEGVEAGLSEVFCEFGDGRKGEKARGVDQATEAGFADSAFADFFVAVTTATEREFAVVEVKGHDALDADQAVELAPHVIVSFFGAEVVAGGEDVAGVHADAEAAGAVESIEEIREMFETRADVAALAGGGFKENANTSTRGALQDFP